MCNEQQLKNELEEKRFIDYRLNQLEQHMEKHNNEIMKTLQIMQESQNQQNRTLIELTERQKNVEQKIQCIDRLKEVSIQYGEEIRTLYKRLDIYKQLLMAVGTGVIISLLIEVIKFI